MLLKAHMRLDDGVKHPRVTGGVPLSDLVGALSVAEVAGRLAGLLRGKLLVGRGLTKDLKVWQPIHFLGSFIIIIIAIVVI